MLAKKIDYVIRGDQLMVIFQERQFQEEADILAVDEAGTLYIFELKRWQSDDSNLLQVIRYGQIFGQYKYDDLERLFRGYIGDTSANLREHHARHFEFDDGAALSPSDFNKKQQFIVVTAGVDIETLDAIRYWRRNNLPISALTYHVYEFGGEFLIEFHSYSPDPDDYAALLANNYVVKTHVTYMGNAYKEMLKESKAAEWPPRSRRRTTGLSQRFPATAAQLGIAGETARDGSRIGRSAPIGATRPSFRIGILAKTDRQATWIRVDVAAAD